MVWCETLSAISFICILIYYFLIKPFLYWSSKGIPQYTVWQIWMNNIVEFMYQVPPAESMNKMYKDFSDKRYFGIYQFFTPKLCIKDPELLKTVLVKDFHYLTDHTFFIPVNGDPVWERTLFCLRGNTWRNTRAVVSPCFTSSKMKFMFELMLECAQQTLRYFEEHSSNLLIFEMKDIFRKITNDMFASTHFGVACDSLKNPNNELLAMGIKGVDFGSLWTKVKFILLWGFPNFSKFFGLKLFDQRINKYFRSIVKENIKHRQKRGIIRPDLIHILMNADKDTVNDNNNNNTEVSLTSFAEVNELTPEVNLKKPRKIQLTEKDITVLVMTFYGGGFDSTSTLASFAAYELALNSNVQEKLQREIDVTLKRSEKTLTYESLMKMKYLDMIVSETLRKWPGGFFIDRLCVEPYTIQPINPGEVPVKLNKGDSLWISLFCLHRDPKYYPDPERFFPERFDNENRSIIHPYAYMPFGVGPRHCIGNRFALMEVKVILFHILSKFSFIPVEKTKIPIKLASRNFQLVSKYGFWLGLKRRQN